MKYYKYEKNSERPLDKRYFIKVHNNRVVGSYLPLKSLGDLREYYGMEPRDLCDEWTEVKPDTHFDALFRQYKNCYKELTEAEMMLELI